MNLSAQIAKHLRDVHFGGNWTSVNLRETLKDVSWQQATTKVQSFNTIAALVYHMSYYLDVVIKVMQGGPLDAKDKYSWEMPPITNEEGWQQLLNKTWSDAETLAGLIENFPEDKLAKDFLDGKYGSNFRNLEGITEHCHYHLGQIVILKKLILQ
jgi:hypothetical protein